MYKGYCVSEQEVVATKTIFCFFALRRGLALLHSQVSFTPICPTLAPLESLWMSQLQFTSSARNRRKHLGIWWGRGVSGMDCRLYRKRRVVRCTWSLLTVPSVKRKHLPHVVWWLTDLYTLSLLLLSFSAPFYRLLLIFSLISSVWSDVGSALQGTDGLQDFTRLLCINLQILEHSYSVSVSDHALFIASSLTSDSSAFSV